MTKILTMTNGDKYEAVYEYPTSPHRNPRAIINMEGAYVLADKVTPDCWEFGPPAYPDELEVFDVFVKKSIDEGTTVKVTDAEGNTTRYVDAVQMKVES